MKKFISMGLLLTTLIFGITFLSTSNYVYADECDDSGIEPFNDVPPKDSINK